MRLKKRRKSKRVPLSRDGRGAACTYCSRRLESTASLSKLAATRDHFYPVSRGGTKKVWCCRQCNALKRDMLPYEWKCFMAANPEWWKRPEFQAGTIPRRTLFLTEASEIANASTDPTICITADHRRRHSPAL
jgi:hypothetical protein